MSKLKNGEHYDVGLVGYWYATNYGSVVTYYALSKAINKLGYSTVIIDCPEKERDPEGEDVFSRKFFKTHGNVSESVKWSELDKLNDYCDNFVIGSDQVWTVNATRGMRHMFFLSFVCSDKRKIAYAPSFGHNALELTPDEFKQVGSYLKTFNKISVREDVGIDLIKNKFGLKADRVLDPVFLMELKEYNKLAAESKLELPEKFMLVYLLDPTPDKELAIKNTADEIGLTVKIILDGRKNTFERNLSKLTIYKSEDVLTEVDACDWVKAFEKAEYVVTDSHHGLAMAIIYNKPFICYANHNRGYARFTSLLNVLGLLDKMVQKSDEINKELIHSKINYEKVNNIIAKEVDRSINWLKEALEDKILDKSISYNLNLKTDCTGCGACKNICPVGAITLEHNVDGFLNPVIDRSKCINCGLCVKKCIALNPSYKNTDKPECRAVIAEDDIREKSSSGGVFTLAANYILKNKGYVCGAAFKDDFSVEHIIISNKKDLWKLRGSKYMQSDIGDNYSKIKKLLDNDNYVLFTGMPCQVAGLHSYLGKEYEKLFTIDILCHGQSSHKVFEKYRKDVLENKTLNELYFKAKHPWGWHAGINATFSDGTKYQKIIEQDPYYIAYIQGLSKNVTCGTCKFNKLPRQGDLTMGDFWRIQDFDKSLNDNKGTSVVLINNMQGQKLINNFGKEMAKNVEVPINYAIAGNGCIIYPYRLNENRDKFFENLDKMNFNDLINNYTKKPPVKAPETLNEMQKEMFYLAKIVSDNYKNRKVLLWGENYLLRDILLKQFGISVEFTLSERKENDNGSTVRHLDFVKGKSKDYYLVCPAKPYNEADYKKLNDYGYQEIKDFVYRIIKPITVKNLDLAKGGYSDAYGNTITGKNGILSEVVFRGANNHIELGENVWNVTNVKFDLSANSTIKLGTNCNFTKPNTIIETKCYDGFSNLTIKPRCYFMQTLFRMYSGRGGTKILINEGCTFGNNVEFHPNNSKKIIIGKDCMFSSAIQIYAGDGHAIFDVKSGSVINSDYNNLSSSKNQTVLGEHVWVGYGAFILQGTNIGNGSIIGAEAVVKGIYPNNVSIAGSPAKIVREDVAWSRDMFANNLNSCNGYANQTTKAKAPISGQNVLVVGGTKFMGVQLVNELLKLGNNVTIATRGKTPDGFGNEVDRLNVDISNAEQCKKVFAGKSFDVVFHNLAYCSNYTKNVLDNVKCKRCVQLSSIAVYERYHIDMKEYEMDTYNLNLKWNNVNDNYRQGKQESETALMKEYKNISSVAVRIPYVTKTERLYYYCDSIVNEKPMNIDDLSRGFTFIEDTEVGKFLPWIAAQNFDGSINFSSSGRVSIDEIIKHIELKTGKKAIIDNKLGSGHPFVDKNFSLNTDKSEQLGYKVKNLHDWFWQLLDEYIDRALKAKK